MATESISLVETLDQLPQLRPFPIVATRVMTVCNDPDADGIELAEIIQCDPAMSLQLLRIANSAQYGHQGRISTVEHAIVVLGFRAVRNLALSVAALSVFNEGEGAQAARQRLWRHSLGCAAVARCLAPHVSRVSADEAFLAGIMHDVGKLVFFDLVPDDYADTCGQADSYSIIELEQMRFGVTHQQVGERCGEQWGLPEEINQAITFHHDPTDAAASHELVAVISAANQLAHAWQVGFGEPASDTPVDEFLRTDLPVDTELLELVRQEAPADFDELRRTCEG